MSPEQLELWMPSLLFVSGALAMFVAGPVWLVAFIQADNPYDSSTPHRTGIVGLILFILGAAMIGTAWAIS